MLSFLLPVLFLCVGLPLHDTVNLLSSTVLFIWVLSIIFIKNFNFFRSKLFLIPLSIPMWYLISAIENSQDPISAWLGGYGRNFGIATFLALSLIFVLATEQSNKINELIDGGLLLLLIMANVYGYIQYFNLDPIPWDSPFTGIVLTLGNPNFSGALFGILLVVAFAKFYNGRNFTSKTLFFFLFISSSFLSLATDSLQSIVLGVIGLISFGFINSIKKSGLRSRIIHKLMILCGISTVVFVFAIFTVNSLQNLKSWLFFQGSVSQRLDYWSNGISVWKDNLFFGVGADQFQRYAAKYRTSEQIIRDGNSVIPDKSHNVLIDHLANGGIIGGFLWISLITLVYFSLYKIIKGDLKNQGEIAVLASVWNAYVVQSFISPDQIVLSVVGFVSGGSIFGRYLLDQNISTQSSMHSGILKNRTFIRPFVAIFLLSAIIFYSQALIANASAKRMLNGEFRTSEEYLDVLHSWPNPKTTELLGVGLARDTANCSLIIKVADRLIELDNRSSQGWHLKSLCAIAKKDSILALDYNSKSLEFDPLNTFYLVTKAKIEIASRQTLAAISTLGQIKKINPNESEIPLLESWIAEIYRNSNTN